MRPPQGPVDGTFYVGNEAAEGLLVPREGKHGVYVWLRDRAGNSDHRTAVALPDALWYDGTSPVTVITRTGSLGLNGWYLGAVSFAMSAKDAASGLGSIRYQVDDGPWRTGDRFTVDTDGAHGVRISSIDIAGNEEPTQGFNVNVDRQAPTVRFNPLPRYQAQPSFEVSWAGSDPVPGSGLAAFDVQVRDGYHRDWRDWLMGTTETHATYTAQRGHTYFFRVAARDVAGNRQPYTAGSTYAVVESVLNGDFDTGNFAEWDTGGRLFKAVVPTTGPAGDSVLAARLGTDAYGPSLDDPGSVPIGSATISQTVRVPDVSEVQRPTLIFWYRVLTYDVLYSKICADGLCDSFDVTLHDAAGQQQLLLRDGNPTQVYRELYDTGWKRASVDLRPYAGQIVRLEFSNWNRNDNLFNTWSYVDDIRVLDWPPYSTYLALVAGGSGGVAAAAAGEPGEAVPLAEPGPMKR